MFWAIGILNITSSISYSPILRVDNLVIAWEISFNSSYGNLSLDGVTSSIVLDEDTSYNMFNVCVWFCHDSFSYEFELFDWKNKLLISGTSIACFEIFYLSSSFEVVDKDVIKKWVEGKVISLGILAILQCEYG